MINVIEYDENIIGYKQNLIKYIKEQNKKIRFDEDMGDEILADYLNENIELLNELDKHNDYELLAICVSAMGDLIIKNVSINIEE